MSLSRVRRERIKIHVEHDKSITNGSREVLVKLTSVRLRELQGVSKISRAHALRLEDEDTGHAVVGRRCSAEWRAVLSECHNRA